MVQDRQRRRASEDELPPLAPPDASDDERGRAIEARMVARHGGPPSLEHFRRAYAGCGAEWPGDDEVRRRHLVADDAVAPSAGESAAVVDGGRYPDSMTQRARQRRRPSEDELPPLAPPEASDDERGRAIEARMAARHGAPTLEHFRRVYARCGADWPGDDEVRRRHVVADNGPAA